MEKSLIKSIQNTNIEVCQKSDSFLQSAVWGRFKSRFGWEARAFLVEYSDGKERSLLALTRRIAPGLTMAYVPWGPELPGSFPDDPSARGRAAAELARILRRRIRSTAFIRFDPPWLTDNSPAGLPLPFKRAAADIQPPDTVLIDLTLSNEDILAAMKPKWRYNIGLASKHGVDVCENPERGLETFYRLLGETAARDGIAIHSIDYYKSLFDECSNDNSVQLRLYTAEHEGDALAAIVVLFRSKQATYLYGASANIKRNVMAAYALQWRAMQDAKTFGCTQYDMFGIPPDEDPNHPMAGLYRFKTGFGGSIVRRPGSWDYPCKPVLYALFNCAEGLRKKIRDRKKGLGVRMFKFV